MSDRAEVDLNALVSIVGALGQRGFSLSERAYEARSLVREVEYLGGPAAGAAADVQLAWQYLTRAFGGLQSLQRDVGARGQAIAESENDRGMAAKFAEVSKPRTFTTNDAVHDSLGKLGFIPGLGGITAGVADTILYGANGEWKSALMSGVGVLPFEKWIAKGFKVGGETFRSARAARAFEDAADGKLPPVGTAERAADDQYLKDAYDRYVKRKGDQALPYDRWLKTGGNAVKAARMMDRYRDALGWGTREHRPEVPNGRSDRRFDIGDEVDPNKKRAIEHKTGGQSRTRQNRWEIERDKKLIEEGWNIVWVFEDARPSKPLLDDLRKAGIPWVIEPDELPPPRPR